MNKDKINPNNITKRLFKVSIKEEYIPDTKLLKNLKQTVRTMNPFIVTKTNTGKIIKISSTRTTLENKFPNANEAIKELVLETLTKADGVQLPDHFDLTPIIDIRPE